MALFVGGPYDGKRQPFPDQGSWVNVPVFDKNDGTYPVDLAAHVGICIHTYTIKRFNDAGHEFQVAFHSSVKNPMAALIKGYRYHRKPRRRR
jgi:hypothetical protein